MTTVARTLARAALALLLAAACGCGAAGPAAEPGTSQGHPDGVLRVVVANYPLEYFARRIGGELIEVALPVPPDVDPATWRPEGPAVATIESADLVLLHGAGYADWASDERFARVNRVDTTAGFRDRLLREGGAIASVTWLDPQLAIEQARGVLEALIAARPQLETTFQQRYGALEMDLQKLDLKVSAALEGHASDPMLAASPVYAYLTRRYGLDVVNVTLAPNAPADAAGWTQIERLRAERPARFMLWDGEPAAATAERLGKLGIESVVVETGSHRPANGEWLSVLVSNVRRLREAFAPKG